MQAARELSAPLCFWFDSQQKSLATPGARRENLANQLIKTYVYAYSVRKILIFRVSHQRGKQRA
jgi:hypothetical protein